MRVSALIVACLVVGVCPFSLQGQSVGPDVVIHDLTDVSGYGTALGITAFAVGTNACNVGTTPVQWTQSNNQHPVIAQNMYRYLDGAFQQVGQSWLKHSFASTNSGSCGTCVQPPQGGAQLGVSCSDAYGASLNGDPSLLGPRSTVNAATGYYPWPHSSPTGDPTIAGRLQVLNGDLGNTSARYFVEAHYVTADDALAGNKNNNATWNELSIPTVGASGNVPFAGPAHWQEQGVMAWKALDSSVNVVHVDIPGDGRVTIAARGRVLPGGTFHYEYAVTNMSSDRGVQGVTVAMPPGATITNMAFHAPFSHSGEPYSNVAWAPAINATGASWSCAAYASDVNANAIRWSTLYNFSFESNMAPGSVTLDLFKPGTPSSITTTVAVNTCPSQPALPPSNNGYTSNPTATYDFVDISVTGNPGPVGDDNSQQVNIGFTFPFYSSTTTQMVIATNGYLCLPGHDGTIYANVGIPDANEPNGLIAPYWDDLYAASGGAGGGTIKYQTVGTAPHRRFIVEWIGIYHYAYQMAASAETFEAILDETTGKITTTIVSTPAAAYDGGGASATRGIKDSTGAVGILTSIDTPGSAVAGTSVTYSRTSAIPPTCVLTLTGNGAANSTTTLTLWGQPGSAVELIADLFPGPTSLGALGDIAVGFPPAFVIADGLGVFGLPDGSATNPCGSYSWSFSTGPVGLASGFTAYVQGVILNSSAPNGFFDISTPVTLIAP